MENNFVSVWLYYYVLLGFWFSVQLFFCTAVFCYRMPRRRFFFPRLFGAIVLYFGAGVLLSLLFPLSGLLSMYFIQLVYYFALWGIVLACVAVCFDIGWKETVFIGIGGYATQHIGYSLSMFVRYYVSVPSGALFNLLFEALPFVAVCALVWFFLVRKGNLQMKRRDLRFLPLAAGMCFSCIVLSVFSSFSQTEEGVFLARVVCRPYALLCCVLTLALLFGFTRENELEREKETMEILLHAETEQHRINKENIEIINIKCHDLKHQIALLRSAEGQSARDEAIAEIEQAIQFYDSNIRTGNDTLDLVLTQKSMFCRNQGIALTCLADGAALEFMRSSDLLSLFGNALDNAIEAVQALPAEKRSIDVRVGRQGGSVFVHMENPCGKVIFRDGLPQTHKQDKAYHGFGVRSIRYIVGKYGGEVRMYTEAGKFNLEILFFLPQ